MPCRSAEGKAQRGCSARLGSARLGLAWHGTARRGTARLGSARPIRPLHVLATLRLLPPPSILSENLGMQYLLPKQSRGFSLCLKFAFTLLLYFCYECRIFYGTQQF